MPPSKGPPTLHWMDKLLLIICLLGIVAAIPLAILGSPAIGVIAPATAKIAAIAISSLGALGIAKTFYEQWPASKHLLGTMVKGFGGLFKKAIKILVVKAKGATKGKKHTSSSQEEEEEEFLSELEKSKKKAKHKKLLKTENDKRMGDVHENNKTLKAENFNHKLKTPNDRKADENGKVTEKQIDDKIGKLRQKKVEEVDLKEEPVKEKRQHKVNVDSEPEIEFSETEGGENKIQVKEKIDSSEHFPDVSTKKQGVGYADREFVRRNKREQGASEARSQSVY